MWITVLLDNGLTVAILNGRGDLIYQHPATGHEVQCIQRAVAWHNDTKARALLTEGTPNERHTGAA